MKLISMTDFVLNSYEHFKSPTLFEETVFKYATFLKQPLKLGMFVPCDEKGNVLEDITGQGMIPYYVEKVHSFLTAKQKVLFKEFSIEEQESNNFSIRDENNILNVMWKFENENWTPAKGIKTIEDLVFFNLELSDTVSF